MFGNTFHAIRKLSVRALVRYEPYLLVIDKFGRGSQLSKAAFDASTRPHLPGRSQVHPLTATQPATKTARQGPSFLCHPSSYNPAYQSYPSFIQ